MVLEPSPASSYESTKDRNQCNNKRPRTVSATKIADEADFQEDNVVTKKPYKNVVSNNNTSTFVPLQPSCPPASGSTTGRISCLNAVYFHPVRNVQDFETPTVSFRPLFVHHFFGLKEELYGFSELRVRIYYTCDTLEVYVKVDAIPLNNNSNFNNQLTPASAQSDNVTQESFGKGDDATTRNYDNVSTVKNTVSSNILSNDALSDQNNNDNENPALLRILSYLTKVPYPGGIHKTEASFLEAIESSQDRGKSFRPPGTLEASFDITNDNSEKPNLVCEMYRFGFCRHVSNKNQGHENEVHDQFDIESSSFDTPTLMDSLDFNYIRQYHRRVEWFLHFFIDACSNIDYDPHWSIRLLFVRPKETAVSKNRFMYEFAGVATLYTFFSVPLFRRRISQFLIFPYFQGRNLGLQALLHVYKEALSDSDIGEITVEDPAKSFGQLRDITGAILAIEGITNNNSNSKIPTIDELLYGSKDSLDNLNDVTVIENMKKDIKTFTKESPFQVHRLLELLLLIKIIPHNIEHIIHPERDQVNNTLDSMQQQPLYEDSFSRDWRPMQQCYKRESIKGKEFHNSSELKTLRIRSKKRLRKMAIETYIELSAEEQRESLWKAWEELFECFCRSIIKLRQWFQLKKKI